MKNRGKRFDLADEATERLKRHLQKFGFIVCQIGQENWLSGEFHQAIRHIFDDKTVDFLRYFPDLATFHKDWETFLIQVKATSPKYRSRPNFSTETASLRNDKLLSAMGVRVLIVWENEPGDFYAEWADKVSGDELSFELSKRFAGSGTPTTLVKKTDIPRLDKLLRLS